MLIWNGSGLIRVTQELSPCHCKNSVSLESSCTFFLFATTRHDRGRFLDKAIQTPTEHRLLFGPLRPCFEQTKDAEDDESWMCLRCFSLSRRNHEDVSTRVRDDVGDTTVSFLGIKNVFAMGFAALQIYGSVACVAFPI